MRIPFSSPAPLRFAAVAAMLSLGLVLAGCSSHGNRDDRPENPFKTAAEGPGGTKSPLSDRELRQQAQELYRHAREALESSDYSVAITRYDGLIARYPFSDYSTQAELEKIYAQYKSFQIDEAITASDRFLRSHPRHPHADYILYIKGVADFNRDEGLLDTMVPDSAKRDIGNERRAFEDFALLLQRYPTSRYAGDARRRMLYARNRIADHELSVAQFYMTRGAYVAAAKRATDIVTEYPGAPATAEALRILQRAYARLGLEQEAKDAATVIAMNSDTVQWTNAPKPGTLSADPNALPADQPAPQKRTWMQRIFGTGKPDTQHTDTAAASEPPPPPAAPANTSAAKSAVDAQAQQSQDDSKKSSGFFGWVSGLFGSSKQDTPPDTKPSPRTPPSPTSPNNSGGASNADTTK
jgi:outer membrane assembly lipoprotein YfiO